MQDLTGWIFLPAKGRCVEVGSGANGSSRGSDARGARPLCRRETHSHSAARRRLTSKAAARPSPGRNRVLAGLCRHALRSTAAQRRLLGAGRLPARRRGASRCVSAHLVLGSEKYHGGALVSNHLI